MPELYRPTRSIDAPVHPDLLVAWPSVKVDCMARETGVRTVNRRRPDNATAERDEAARDAPASKLEAQWAAESQGWEAAHNITLDEVIRPGETREIIAESIEFAWGSHERVSARGC